MPNDTYPEHVVTAVIVAHDGSQWLSEVTGAVLEQTHQVYRTVAVDTGSRDRSGAVLADLLGHEVVFGMDRQTGYGSAVARALRHPAANTRAGGRVEWIWLLHDDCAPAPDALEQLLRGAVETPSAAVLGPKVLDWSDQQVILEVGLAIDTAGRRITGTEPREIDQGQHDGDRDVLAVSTAGMLIRRDVWEEAGGFDPRFILFREDVDFCWRVHAAGYRVRLITDAVVYHLEATTRGRRQVSATAHPRRLDRRNALLVLCTNLPLPAMIASLLGNAGLSVARILFFLLAKRAEAARDEAAAFGFILAHPWLLLSARRRRRAGSRRAYGALRSQVPRGRSLRKLAEFAVGTLSRTSPSEAAGTHHASDDPSDDDSLLIDSGLAQRVITNPGVLLLAGLTLVALVAERSLLGGGPLGGGALLPAWGGAGGLWSEYLSGFHAVGVGSAASAPPYVAVLAILSTILGGKPWLAVSVILIGCVPLAGLTAYFAARRVSSRATVRVWLAATYALLPIAAGTVAAGRLGTAVVFVLLPLIAGSAWRMLTGTPRRARRAAWATGLMATVAAAFVPLVWVVAVIVAAFAGIAIGRARRALALNLVIVALVPPILLAPWTIQVAQHPSLLLLEAGLQRPGLASRDIMASSLLLLRPGGPGLPPAWITGGLILAALAALLLGRRWLAVAAAWAIALAGLLIAIAVSRVLVSPPDGSAAIPAWPSVGLLIAAVGLLLAGAAAGERLHDLFAAGGPRRMAAVAAAVVACSTPVLAAGYWLINGVSGPVAPVAGPILPEFVSVSSANGLRLRTLVLRSAHGTVSYALLRGDQPPLGATELAEPVPAARSLARVVAGLATPGGSDIGNAEEALARFAIGYVLLPAPVDPGLARLLDGVSGLQPVSQTSAFQLWRLAGTVGRVVVTESSGAQVALPSGPVDLTNTPAPPAGGTVVLAEPASGSWHASLNGRPLTPLSSPVNGWAQGFTLPPGGGTLSITRDETGRSIAVALEFAAVVVVGALALPGARESGADAGHAARGASGRGTRAREQDREQRGDGHGDQGPAPHREPRPSRGRGIRRRVMAGRPEEAGSRRAGGGRARAPGRGGSRSQPSPRGRGHRAARGRAQEREAGAGHRHWDASVDDPYEYPAQDDSGDDYPRQAAPAGDYGYPDEPAEDYDHPAEAGRKYPRHAAPGDEYGQEYGQGYGEPDGTAYDYAEESPGYPEGGGGRYRDPDAEYQLPGREGSDGYQYPADDDDDPASSGWVPRPRLSPGDQVTRGREGDW